MATYIITQMISEIKIMVTLTHGN